MNRSPRRLTRKSSRRLVTTIGDLISAAYDVVPGAGSRKVEQALVLLTRSPLARHLQPHVEFTR